MIKEDIYNKINKIKQMKLKINMERGWPSKEQLELSLPMLDMVTSKTNLLREVDYRGYAGTGGILPLKRLFADMLSTDIENVYIGGTMSTTIMYDIIEKMCSLGKDGNPPWNELEDIKFICPSPGYEKHFKICKRFNITMLPVPMNQDGPDMDIVEKMVIDDCSIKGIWCVPLYSNPTGIVYSDEVVRRLANMQTAARDFIIMWDNAYCVHHLTKRRYTILNILDECTKAGQKDRVFEFTSTSKITFPGAGVGVCASSVDNIKWLEHNSLLQLKTGDKINQLRHYLFLQNMDVVHRHMEKHAAIIKPKFNLIDKKLRCELREIKGIKWNNPKGGYFMHIELLPNMAKAVWMKCKELGVSITPAGSTYPYGIDPQDSTIRLAPTYLSLKEISVAMDVFCCVVKLVYSKNKTGGSYSEC